jgi:hypothetical protein
MAVAKPVGTGLINTDVQRFNGCSKLKLFATSKFCILPLLVFTSHSCGNKSVQSSAEKSAPRVQKIAPSKTSATVPSAQVIPASFSFIDTENNSSCQGLFVSSSLFISPSHCFEVPAKSKQYRVKIVDVFYSTTVAGIIERPSPEAEDLAIIEMNGDFHIETFLDLKDFSLPEKIYPPFSMKMVSEGTYCNAMEYDAKGMIAYTCPTKGSMSGALLMSAEGLPFAIHVGRKSSLGYGIVLGSIKDALTTKIAEYRALNRENKP